MTKKLLFLVALSLSSCAGDRTNVAKMEEKIDSLQKENALKEQDLNDMTSFMSALADGLDSIAKHEEMLFYSNKGKEGTITDRNQLKRNLAMFEELLNHQKLRISQMADSLKARGTRISKLSNLVNYLNQQLDEKNGLIKNLRSELDNKNLNISQLQKRVSSLTEDNAQLSRKVEAQVQALTVQNEMINEGYVKIGTKKQLSDLGIITGGFLKKKRVNPNAIQQRQFMRVDIRSLKELPLKSDDVKILTQMPSSSYRIVTTGKNQSVLYILDPTAFWSISNYLIIQI